MEQNELREALEARTEDLVKTLSDMMLREAAARIMDLLTEEALAGVHAPATPARGARVGFDAGRRGRRSRDELEELTRRVYGLIFDRPGLTIGELADELSLETADLGTPIRWLRELDAIRLEGNTRRVRYFPNARTYRQPRFDGLRRRK